MWLLHIRVSVSCFCPLSLLCLLLWNELCIMSTHLESSRSSYGTPSFKRIRSWVSSHTFRLKCAYSWLRSLLSLTQTLPIQIFVLFCFAHFIIKFPISNMYFVFSWSNIRLISSQNVSLSSSEHWDVGPYTGKLFRLYPLLQMTTTQALLSDTKLIYITGWFSVHKDSYSA